MKEDAVEAACLRAALATDQLRGADALETARGHALDEIVASEETYVANMRICLEVFRDPLRDLLGRDEVLGRVMKELSLLEKFQATFLGELRLERARDECFGRVFRKFAPVWKSNCRDASPPRLNHDLHTIKATPARWRGRGGLSPLDAVSTVASSPRMDLVKNYRVHPTHWLIDTQVRALLQDDGGLRRGLRGLVAPRGERRQQPGQPRPGRGVGIGAPGV